MTPSPEPQTSYSRSAPFLRWLAPIPIPLSFALALTLASCGGDGGSGPGSSAPTVATVEISPSPVTLDAGLTAQLTATCRDSSGSPMPCGGVSWSSSADAVATVSSTGLLTAVSDGSVTITARAGGRSGNASVEVLPGVPQETVTATVAGGTFAVLDGAVTLEIPAGAVASTTEITVRAKEAVTGEPYVPGSRYEFAPDGLNFAESVTLTIAFDTAGIPVAAEDDLFRLHRVSPGGPELVLGSRLDLDKGTASGLIDGFSEFGASQATIGTLLDGIDAMAFAMEAGDQAEVDILREAIRQDIRASFTRVDAQCLATSSLSVKAPLLKQLLQLQTIVQSLGLEDLTELTLGPCGNLADPYASTIEVTPSPVQLGLQMQTQLEAKIRGPNGEELTGEIEWHSQDPGVASVSSEGQVLGVHHGETMLAIVSADIDWITGYATVNVLPDLVLIPSPSKLILPMGRDGGLAVLVQDTSRGLDVSTVPIDWTIEDQSIVSELGTSPGPPPNLAVRPELLGETHVKACARGFGPGSCAFVPVSVVYNVEGVWHYNETLYVELEPPWTEVCVVNGHMTVGQSRDTYSGEANENATCTFDAGDGTDPVVTSFSAEGEITDGKIKGNQFSHRGEFDTSEGTEWCRTEGTLFETGEPGFARRTNGTVRCLDEEDYYSSGPSGGTWQRLADPAGAVGAAPITGVPFWPPRRPPKPTRAPRFPG